MAGHGEGSMGECGDKRGLEGERAEGRKSGTESGDQG